MTNFYDSHATSFIDNTLHVDMQPLYEKFLPLLTKGAKILDAGCGAGRDAKYFHSQGFEVTAFDASIELSHFAQKYTKLAVHHCSFNTFQSADKFDAIWACASLLHVAKKELAATFDRLGQFLTESGIFYCSFKYGNEEVTRDGRTFTNLNENSLAAILSTTSLGIQTSWVTGDQRVGRENETWLNALLVHDHS